MNSRHLAWVRRAVLACIALALGLVFAVACTFVYLAPSLPTAQSMRGIEMAVPLRVLTANGELISRFGEEPRIPVRYEDIPVLVRHAVLASEDDRFFEHGGVDWRGFCRAVFKVVTSGRAVQGGSTVTQQTARQLFLTTDKTLRRKLGELFLTWRMERDFTKEQILSLYLNKIYFGQRTYGIAAAAETYYNRKLDELTVAQAATLAGIIQSPNRFNPVTRPRETTARRAYVLGRMLKVGYIDKATAERAGREPVAIASHTFGPMTDLEADYVAEQARQFVEKRWGAAAINNGFTVYTTIDARLQPAANKAVRLGLLDYDGRHGYRGKIGRVDLDGPSSPPDPDALLLEFRAIDMLLPAVVTQASSAGLDIHVLEHGAARIDADGVARARTARGKAVSFRRGDVLYVVANAHGGFDLAQRPEAQAALVALDPHDGAIVSLVGGFDFRSSAYNRAIQAQRQPGSGFKPILYSAALDNGFTAASLVSDMPLATDECDSAETVYQPKNSHGDFLGIIRLREGLVFSRNLMSLHLMLAVGIEPTIEQAAKFGFDPKALPRHCSLALGSLSATPLQMASAYAVFANGGFRVEPYLIRRVEDRNGKVLFEATPKVACPECEKVDAAGNADVPEDRRAPRVISAQNAWLVSDILHDAATRGTGKGTQLLGRDDLAGKTGTTDEARDNWFNGFNQRLVATVWIGFDDNRSLGEAEEGASTAVPTWNRFMAEALHGMPSSRMERPGGILEAWVSSATGELLEADAPDARVEFFMEGHGPAAGPALAGSGASAGKVDEAWDPFK